MLNKILNFYSIGKYVNKIPTHADLPEGIFKKHVGNSHFRKGLLDEWKTACTPEQIKWMTNQINPELMVTYSIVKKYFFNKKQFYKNIDQ